MKYILPLFTFSDESVMMQFIFFGEEPIELEYHTTSHAIQVPLISEDPTSKQIVVHT